MRDLKDQPIFVVDDDSFIAELYRQYLGNLGYKNSRVFLSGQDCLDHITANPKMIFIDYQMDSMNGFELLKKIKRFDPNIYVVMISGQENIDIAVESLKYGAFDYITKSEYTLKNLEKVLDRIAEFNNNLEEAKPTILKSLPIFFHLNIMRLIKIFAVLMVFGTLTSCKTQNIFELTSSEAEELAYDSISHYNPNYQYCLRQDDKITISVWGQTELSVGSTYGIYNSNEVYGKWLMVDAFGNIEIPKIGTMNVMGMTLVQLKNQLKDSMQKWLVNPVVDVKVLNKEISLIGEFKSPIVVTVDKEHNYLLTMVAKAGGFDKYANLQNIKVLRQVGPHVQLITLDLTGTGNFKFKNIPLYPGDVIMAPSRKYKNFDSRVSTIIPFTSVATAGALLFGI